MSGAPRTCYHPKAVKPLLVLLVALTALHAAPTVETVVDNDRVRVLKVTVGTDHTTKMHEHKVNRVMVYLDKGGQKVFYEDGRQVMQKWDAGEPLWSPAVGMHRVETVADRPQTIIEIELKQPGPKTPQKLGPLDPLAADPGHYGLVFENDQVRVIRVKVGPEEKAPMHEHLRARVVTYLTDADFGATFDDGRSGASHQKAGDVVWSDQVTRHSEVNNGTNTFEGVVVELK